MIQKFQQQTKLSLSAIARVFSAAGYNAHAIEIELLSARHSVTRDDNIIPLQNQPAANRELGLPADFVQRLVDGSLLTSTAGGENENQLAALLWAAHDAGVPLAFFEQAQKKVAIRVFTSRSASSGGSSPHSSG